MTTFFLGCDLGQSADYSTLAIVQAAPRSRELFVRHLERFPLRTSYCAIVEAVKRTMHPLRQYGAELAIDGTGVGAAVTDLFTEAGVQHTSVILTAGQSVEWHGARVSVPKKDIIAVMVAALQAEELPIAKTLKYADTLKQELLNYRAKVNIATGHESFEAWREGVHDDLVLAVGLAAWQARRGSQKIMGLYSYLRERQARA